MTDPTTLRICAAAIEAGLKKNYGPTHPQAGKFTPEFLTSVSGHLGSAASDLAAAREENATFRKLLERFVDIVPPEDRYLAALTEAEEALTPKATP